MTGAKPGDLGAAKLETKGPPIALPLGIAESLGAVPWVPMPHIHTALRSFVAILCLSAPTSAQCLIELDLGQYDEGSALAISADGSAVVGLVRNQFGTIHRDACVWRGAGNIEILLTVRRTFVGPWTRSARESELAAWVKVTAEARTPLVAFHKKRRTKLLATVARHFGFYSIHPCRVLYVIREPELFTYGFGTLHGHGESGEERFRVSLDGEAVRYDIQAFSRPQGLLSSMTTPIVRRFQARFFRERVAAMEQRIE